MCGLTSYFGEDGGRDAFEGLMEVLRLRLLQKASAALPEPWAKGAQVAAPIPRAWFAECAAGLTFTPELTPAFKFTPEFTFTPECATGLSAHARLTRVVC